MPHAPSQAIPGRLPAAPPPVAAIPSRQPSIPPTTPEARIDALIALLRQANERQRAELRELADDLLGQWIGEQIGELLEEQDGAGGADVRAPGVYGDEPFEADWQRFLRGHPNHIDLKQAREQFVKLRPRLADPEFNERFFERLADWAASAAWKSRKYGSPYWYLKNEQWEDAPLGPDGKPAVGQLQRERLKAESKARIPLASQLAASLRMPAAPPADPRTPYQFALDSLLAALTSGVVDLIEKRRAAFLASGGKRSELIAIEADHAKRTKKEAR